MTDRDIDREDVEDWTGRDWQYYVDKGVEPPTYYQTQEYHDWKANQELKDAAEQAKAEYRDNNVGEQKDTRHPSSQRFHQILRSLGDLHDKKQRDYGTSSDPFANVRASEAFGIPPWLGAIVRGNDKMRRIMTASNQVLSGEEIAMANEAFEDALQDLAVYAIIALVLYEEEQAW